MPYGCPKHLLADPCMKTVRAKEHLDELKKRLVAFEQLQPYTVTRQDDLEKQCANPALRCWMAPQRSYTDCR